MKYIFAVCGHGVFSQDHGQNIAINLLISRTQRPVFVPNVLHIHTIAGLKQCEIILFPDYG